LRSLAFASGGGCGGDCGFELLPGDEVYTQEAAYRFLLEVVCGLKSPIVGETEVFGQFKLFSQEWLKLEPKHSTLVQKVLSDAKAIRSEYLTGLGIQSYGSWVRGTLKPTRVHFLGGGQLVREIYPYLEKQQRDLVLHLRDREKAAVFSAPVHALDEQAFDSGALIIAAPMTAREIGDWLNGEVPRQIIDLRGDSHIDRLQLATQTEIHLLSDIFAQIEKTKAKLLPRLQQVDREIRERSAKAASQSQVRPQGWDDLCA
jgi:glutamyl-tRNA reductase